MTAMRATPTHDAASPVFSAASETSSNVSSTFLRSFIHREYSDRPPQDSRHERERATDPRDRDQGEKQERVDNDYEHV